MAERSTIAQAIQLGVETTPGTAVAATKRLLALSMSLNVADDVSRFQPKGSKYPTVVYPGKEWSDVDVSGTATYSELQYPMSSALTTPTVAQIMDGGTATGAYRWTFEPNTFGADTPKTFTVEQGDNVRAHRAANVILSGFSIRGNRKEVTIGGDGYGSAIQDGVVMTSSGVTSIETIPILPTQVDVFLDPTHTALGTTKQLRVLDWSWNVSSRYGSLFVVDSENPSFVAHVERDPGSTFKIKAEADAQTMALLNTYRQASSRFLRVNAKGPKIYTGAGVAQDVHNQLRIESAGKVSNVSKFDDEDGVYAIEFTFDTVHDSSWGRAFRAELINGQATL